MRRRVRIPLSFAGTDLQFAYLDGLKDGEDNVIDRNENFCEPEDRAYDIGFIDGQRSREAQQGGGGL